ncbi:alpha/beta fold hydrolase [Corynebacterium gerontici]|uniref:Non-heme chloroperoxidase n=1 Tax=Corynebacterium gerontici TaxID=2079234 RepID=A0A3G6J1F3_9CORY|nr:alpha/beta hydrolase [Corynebacterium gerontici]AZA11855.1 Non-heme chloroperoxidase [Corynebacterium gerontici]
MFTASSKISKRRKQALQSAQRNPIRRNNFFKEHRTIDGVHYYLDGPEDADVTIVYIHGFTLAAKSWHLQVAHIGDRARHVLIDLRGHGETGEYPIEDCTIDGAADDVALVYNHLGINGDTVVIGHSLGGMVALNLLRRFKKIRHNTRACILVATAVESFASQGFPQVLALPIVDNIRNAVELAPKQVQQFREDIAALIAPTLATTVFVHPTPDSIINFHAHMINDTPLNTLVGFLDDLQQHNETCAQHPLQDIPGAVIVGEKDLVTPLSQAQRIIDMWPSSSLQEIPDAGHMIILEQPWVINKALDHALNLVEHPDTSAW